MRSTQVMRSVGNTERVFKNDVALKVREVEAEAPGDFEKIRPYVAGLASRTLRCGRLSDSLSPFLFFLQGRPV